MKRFIERAGWELDTSKISAVGPVEIGDKSKPTFIVIVDSNQIRCAWPLNRDETNGEWESRVVDHRDALMKRLNDDDMSLIDHMKELEKITP